MQSFGIMKEPSLVPFKMGVFLNCQAATSSVTIWGKLLPFSFRYSTHDRGPGFWNRRFFPYSVVTRGSVQSVAQNESSNLKAAADELKSEIQAEGGEKKTESPTRKDGDG
jgi:hypothetical protein